MLSIVGIVVILILVVVFYEYRYRRPDQVILVESQDKIIVRKGKLYPRHFSLAIPLTAYPMNLKVESIAKGNLIITVKLSIIILPATDNIQTLIRVGGWKNDATIRAAKELEILISGFVKEFTEKYGIEDLSSEKLYQYLDDRKNRSKERLGLDIVSLIVQSVDPVDEKIADALRQQESARIVEQTEKLNQLARLNSVRIRIKTDEEILTAQNELELKKYELKKVEIANEAVLAKKRVEDELLRNKMKLDFEKEELEILKNNPELLLLTPQAAKLAEASQSLKNAKTIVNLSSTEMVHNPEFLNLFQNFLQSVNESYTKNKKSE
jgi:hypothetical protein